MSPVRTRWLSVPKAGLYRPAALVAWLLLAAAPTPADEPGAAPGPASRPAAAGRSASPPAPAAEADEADDADEEVIVRLRPAPGPTTAPANEADPPVAGLPVRRDPPKGLPTLTEGDSPGWTGRMLAYLVLVLLLGGAGIVVARRFLPRLHPTRSARKIRLHETFYLGPRKQLHVVQVGRQSFLVASCRDRISMLAELKRSFDEVYENQTAGAAVAAPPDEPLGP
jgi:flagellar biogenesis protein FliO